MMNAVGFDDRRQVPVKGVVIEVRRAKEVQQVREEGRIDCLSHSRLPWLDERACTCERSAGISHSRNCVKCSQATGVICVERAEVELSRCDGERVNVLSMERSKTRVGAARIGMHFQRERSIHATDVASGRRPVQTERTRLVVADG